MSKTKKNVNYKQIYEKKGYCLLTHSDLVNRFYSFLMDVCVMLAPIMIWDIIMMAVLGSLVSVSGIVMINIAIGVLLIVSIIFVNAYIYTQTRGQSLGKRFFNFKLIRKNGDDVHVAVLVLRELLGFSLPFLACMYFFNIFGVMLFWMINGLIVCLDPWQRSIPDLIFGTRSVKVKQSEEIFVEKEHYIPVEEQEPYTSRVDLHLYSDFSSHGECDVEALFQLASKNHLQAISITDVDCAKANSIAVRMGELYHINYIPGITLNCEYKGVHLQVLGYFIDYSNDLYTTIENESLVNEKRASIERVRRFEELIKKPIDMQYLLENNRFQKLPGEYIARHVLYRKEFKDCELLQPYRKYQNIDEAAYILAKDYFSPGKPCFVRVKYPSLEDVLEVISMTGGVSILAHPAKLVMNHPKFVEELVDKGVQGIEVFYPSHKEKELIELMQFAIKHKLFITGGSGFYSKNRSIKLGRFHANEQVESILEKFCEQ